MSHACDDFIAGFSKQQLSTKHHKAQVFSNIFLVAPNRLAKRQDDFTGVDPLDEQLELGGAVLVHVQELS